MLHHLHKEEKDYYCFLNIEVHLLAEYKCIFWKHNDCNFEFFTPVNFYACIFTPNAITLL